MPVNLNNPAQPPQLLNAKILRINIEHNVENWVEVYVGYGNIDGSVFTEYIDPMTGVKVQPTYYKIENGNHPRRPGMSLRKCVDCGKWWKLETECDCGGTGGTEPYDGMSRLMGTPPIGSNMHENIGGVLYQFLLTEQIPDADTWEVGPLLDATMEV